MASWPFDKSVYCHSDRSLSYLVCKFVGLADCQLARIFVGIWKVTGLQVGTFTDYQDYNFTGWQVGKIVASWQVDR